MKWSRKRDPVLRFNERVIKEKNGCWQWQGKLDSVGYGIFKINGHNVLVHRWAYEIHKGSIPEGMVIHHQCENRCCVNPDHLELVTSKENNILAKVHCSQGHPFTEENTITLRTGQRLCRICNQERRRKYRVRSSKLRQEVRKPSTIGKAILVFASDISGNRLLVQELEKLRQKGLILNFSLGEEE